MNINLKIYGKTAIFEPKKIINSTNIVKIHINAKQYEDMNYVAKYNEQFYDFKNGVAELPLVKGIANIIIYLMKNGEVVKSWITDNLIVNEVNDGIEFLPEVEYLKNELSLANKTIEDLKLTIELLKTDNEIIKKILAKMTGVEFGGVK